LAITFPRTSSSVQGATESPPFQFQLQSGQLHGIRVVADTGGNPVIKHIDPQSPAAAQNLNVGNRLISINGKSVTSLHEAHGVFYQLGTDVSLQTEDGKHATWSLAEFPQRTRPVHPTQIYSSIHAGLLCLFLLAYYPFRKRDGEVIALCLTIYPVSRFLLEIIRADEKLTQNLTISQLVSLLLLGIIIAVWTYVLRQPRECVFPPA
jgi:phosphatidylglycerol:prolipoprotein diacylglycerol transferase